MITTTLKPTTKKDIIGIATYNPDDGTIWLDCCQSRDWEKTKDYTGINEGCYKSALRSEGMFESIIKDISSKTIACFASDICAAGFLAYGYSNYTIFDICATAMIGQNRFIPWEDLAENPSIPEWARYINRQKRRISRNDLASTLSADKADKRIYGIKCLDNLEVDAAIWHKAITQLC